MSIKNFSIYFRNWMRNTCRQVICLICFILLFKDGGYICIFKWFRELRICIEAFTLSVKYNKIIPMWSFKTNVGNCHFPFALVFMVILVHLTSTGNVILTLIGRLLNFWIILSTESSGEITSNSIQYLLLNGFEVSLK